MKKIVVLLFMNMMLLVTSLSANAYSFEVDGIYYNITDANNKTCGVAPKNGDDELGMDGSVMEKAPYNKDAYSGIVKIPEKVMYLTQEYTVKSIDNRAFINCTELTEVIIPNTVTSIGEYAFWNCKKLKKLHIPKSVTSIPFYTSGYGTHEHYFYGCDSLEEISVEEGNACFSSMNNCNAIISYRKTIPQNVTDTVLIFAPASAMTIPNSVNCISGAFFNSKIKKLDIPSSVKSIGEYSFCGSKKLEEIRIADGESELMLSPVYSLKYDALGTFKDCPLKSIYIGRPITYNSHIYYSSPFDGCDQLKYVEFGDCIDNITVQFEECKNIETIVLGKSVTNIGGAFYKCEKIKSISVKNINPPKVSIEFSDVVYTNSILNIPKGTLDVYMSHSVWGKFKNIVESIDIVYDTEHNIIYDEFVYNNSDSTCTLANTKKDSYNYGINRTYNSLIKGYKFVSVGDGKKALNGTLSISLPVSIQYINDYSLSKISGGSDYNQNEKDYKIQIPIDNDLKYIGAYAFPANPFDRFRLHINKNCKVHEYAFATNGASIQFRSNITIDSENPYIGLDGGVIFFKGSEDIVRYFIHETENSVAVVPVGYTNIENISTTTSLENITFEDERDITYLRLTNCNLTDKDVMNFNSIDTITNELFKNCTFNIKKISFPNAKYVEEPFDCAFKHLHFDNVETLGTECLFKGTADTLSVYVKNNLGTKLFAGASIGRLNWLNDDVPFSESMEAYANRINVLNLGNAKAVGISGLMYSLKARSEETSILLSTSTPPEVLSIVLYDDYPSKVKLYVPAGSGEAYRNHEKWGVIPTIIEYDVNGPDPTSGINSVINDGAEAAIDVYNLQGVRVRKGVKRNEATQDLPQGIYIINGEKILVK